MLHFNTYKNFIKNFNKNRISLVYGIEKNVTLSKIDNLINVVLEKKIASYLSLLKGRYIEADIVFLDTTLIELMKLRIIRFISMVKKF